MDVVLINTILCDLAKSYSYVHEYYLEHVAYMSPETPWEKFKFQYGYMFGASANTKHCFILDDTSQITEKVFTYPNRKPLIWLFVR